MKNSVLKSICFSFILMLSHSSCTVPNDKQLMGLKGKVKTYLEKTYEVEKRFGQWEEGDMADYGHMRRSFTEEGVCTGIEALEKNGRLISKIINRIEKGKVIQQENYNGEGGLESIVKFNYASNGDIEYEIWDTENNKQATTGKDIFKNKRNVKSIFKTYLGGNLYEMERVFEYDKNGDLACMKGTQTDGEGNIEVRYESYEYIEFDENGNWTKKLVYKEGEDTPVHMIIREFEYY